MVKLKLIPNLIPNPLSNPSRLRTLSGQMDKQYGMLRLIVQKMEIHSEADEQDEGDAPSGDDGAMRMR